MGRAGRYTLSVMVWVATFAAWSLVVGLVVAAVTGDDLPDSVAVGWSALFYVVLSGVPTVAALVFNDWARDGFPSKDDRRRAARAARSAAPAPEPPALVPPVPLDLPEGGPERPADGGYPVAPLLRDR